MPVDVIMVVILGFASCGAFVLAMIAAFKEEWEPAFGLALVGVAFWLFTWGFLAVYQGQLSTPQTVEVAQ